MEYCMLLQSTVVFLALLSTLLLGANIGSLRTKGPHATYCTQPVRRREWRTLRQEEQLAYLGAVVCLANTPSPSNSIGTIYDDFAFVHMQIGAHGENTQVHPHCMENSDVISSWSCAFLPMASYVYTSVGEASQGLLRFPRVPAVSMKPSVVLNCS